MPFSELELGYGLEFVERLEDLELRIYDVKRRKPPGWQLQSRRLERQRAFLEYALGRYELTEQARCLTASGND